MIGDLRGRSLAGRFCHAPVPGGLDIFDGLISLDARGDIASVVRSGDPAYAAALREASPIDTPSDTIILPGFVDLHVHAPQYPQLGTALDVSLDVWLRERTFPLEARYADLAFARRVYSALVADLLAGGTTTCVYFATIHQDATRLLVDLCLEHGQRALIGKVAMDHPEQCPDFYRDASVEAALEGTMALIAYVRTHPGNAGLVHPVVTPRFVPSCTDATLLGLGLLAETSGCHVQTHCSESDWQHAHVHARFGQSDAEVLDGFGLLGRRSVLAHGVMLADDDLDRLVRRGSGIAHCAHSNAYFGNAVFPLRAALARGVRVGLGTDIAGGPSASMFDACRMTVAASRMLEDGVDPRLPAATRGRPGSRVDFATAFHLATAGGADVLDLPVGRFAPGCHFDAMLISPDGGLRRWDGLDREEDVLQKIVYGASRADIGQVWVGGVSRK